MELCQYAISSCLEYVGKQIFPTVELLARPAVLFDSVEGIRMRDKHGKERIGHCRRMAAQAEAQAASSGADFRETWNAIAESWDVLAREFEYDTTPTDWSASALERNSDTVGSPHLLKTLLIRQRRGDPQTTGRTGDRSPPRVERRPKSRRRVLLSGEVSYFNGTHEFACPIRDLSETGASLSLERDSSALNRFGIPFGSRV